MTLANIRRNPIMLTDSYNPSHQSLKINTDFEVSHIYNRKEGMIFYGFAENILEVLKVQITKEMVDEAEYHAKRNNLVFPRAIWDRVVDELNGYIPIQIETVPEGMWCPKGTPFAQVRNTVKGFGEMVTWLEGIMLHNAFASGCATEAFHMRRYLEELKPEYGESIMTKIHSFGFRGHRSLEDAYWAGTAWNLFLVGTDDFHTNIHTPNAEIGSISALAHKVTQQYDVEYNGYIHTIDATAEEGQTIVAMVIDTYDPWRFIESHLVPLSHYAKQKGVHLVIRPDSGDVNEQAVAVYKTVQQAGLTNVSVIIGENMSYQNIKRTDFFLNMRQVPLNFVSYGVGGGFYNHINRDTLGYAMKTAFSNGRPRMKFGAEALKRSIPDKVVVHVNEEGNLAVSREKDWLTGDVVVNMYDTIYLHDHRSLTPYTFTPKWEDTQALAQYFLHEELQEQIVLSDSINELVKEFEKTYA